MPKKAFPHVKAYKKALWIMIYNFSEFMNYEIYKFSEIMNLELYVLRKNCEL